MARQKRGRQDEILMHFAAGVLVGVILIAVLLVPEGPQSSGTSQLPIVPNVPVVQPPNVPGAIYTGTFRSFDAAAEPSSFTAEEGKRYSITFRSANTNGIPGWAGDLFVYPDAAARAGTCTGPANPMWVVEDGETVQRNYGVSGAWETPILFADMGEGRIWQGLLKIDSIRWGSGYAKAEATAVASAAVYLRNGDSKISDNAGCVTIVVEEI